MAYTKHAADAESSGVYGGECSEGKPTHVEFTNSIRIRKRYADDAQEMIGEPSGTQTNQYSRCPISRLLQVDHSATTLRESCYQPLQAYSRRKSHRDGLSPAS